MKKIGYIRTSTEEQYIDRQVNLLKEVCDQVFIEDGVSAVHRNRPVFNHVLELLETGDMFVVSSQDRAFRSATDALLILEKLHRRGIVFLSLTQNFDTTTPDGKFMYTIAAALATWERDILSLRTKEGLQAARRRGKTLGRPRKLNEQQIREARQQLEAEFYSNLTEVAESFRVHERTLMRAIKRTQIPWKG